MTEDPKKHLETVRDYARRLVAQSSLRPVAEEIEISHTALAGFIRSESPREPYGVGRRRLILWGIKKGVIPEAAWERKGWRKLGDLAEEAAREIREPRQPGAEELARIRKHLRRMSAGQVGEMRLIMAERMMCDDLMAPIRIDQRKEVPLDDRLAWIDRTFRFICETLEDEGYDFSYDPDAPANPIEESEDASQYVSEDEAEEAEGILDQLPPLPKPETKRRQA